MIVAPHQRLIERDPQLRSVLDTISGLPHVHVDLDSFAMVDGSYTGQADIYLGDTSSQVVEFLMQPRPCVFLDNYQTDWRQTNDHGFWACGEVVQRFDRIMAALIDAPSRHDRYLPIQRVYVAAALGDCGPEAPVRAAQVILQGLSQERTSNPRARSATA